MANEWQSALPSAWKPQDPQILTNAFQAGAQLPLIGAEAAAQNANAQSTQQETAARAGLQAAFAGGIKSVPVLDPQTGAPVMDPQTGAPMIKHQFDDDQFKAHLKDNPGAADAYAKFSAVAYPQMQAEASNALYAAAGATDDQGNPTGGLDPAKAAEFVQAHPEFAGHLTKATQEASSAQYRNAAEIANYKMNLLANGVREPNLAEGTQLASPASAVGQDQMRPTMPFGQSQELFKPKTGADIPTDPQTRAALIKGLQADGVTGANRAWTNEQLADAMNQVARNAITAGVKYDFSNPSANASNMATVRAQAPSIAQAEWGKILPGGTSLAGAQLGQIGTGQNITNTANTMKVAQEFNSRGFSGVTAANLPDAQKLQGEVTKVHSSAVMAKSLADNPTKVANMTPDQFGEEIFNSLKGIKTAEGVSTISADDNLSSYFRPGASVGKVLAQSEGLADFVKGVIRSDLSKAERISLLRDIQAMAETAEKGGIARSALKGAYGAGKMPWEVGPKLKISGPFGSGSGSSQDNPITITSKNAPTISGNWYRYNGVTRRAP